MFRINSIAVRVEGENNYMSENLKYPGYFIRILLELSMQYNIEPCGAKSCLTDGYSDCCLLLNTLHV